MKLSTLILALMTKLRQRRTALVAVTIAVAAILCGIFLGRPHGDSGPASSVGRMPFTTPVQSKPGDPQTSAPSLLLRSDDTDKPTSDRSTIDVSGEDRRRANQAVGALAQTLREMERASSEVLDTREQSKKQYISIALRNPTPAELKSECNKAVSQSGITSASGLQYLKHALEEVAGEFRVPEGAVCRVLMLTLDLSRNRTLVEYSVIGVADLSHLRLKDGKWPVPPIMLPTTTSGSAWPDGEWRFSGIVEVE